MREQERDWQRVVAQAAKLTGWHIAHFRPARSGSGEYRTPVEFDGAGFPDLVLVKGRRLIFAELKGEHGRLSALQADWLDRLRVTAAEVYVWRPGDWQKVRHILAHGPLPEP